jgi:O-antigen/teichoic acid export membrane protein
MKTALNKIFSSEGLRKSIFLVSANLTATAIAAVSLIIFSRILGPTKFAEFSVGVSIIFILIRLTDLGSTQALLRFIPIKKSNQEKTFLFQQLTFWRAKLTVIILILATLAAYVSLKLGYSAKPEIVFGAILFTAIIAIYDHFYHGLLSLGLIAQAASMNGIQAVTKLIAAIAAMILGVSTAIVNFTLYSLAPVLGVISGFIFLPQWIKKISTHTKKQLPAKINTFISHSAIGVIAAGVMENISVLQLKGMLGDFETGVFGGISRISLFAILGATYLSQVLFPRVTKYTQRDVQKKYLKKTALFIILISVGFLLYIPFNKLAILLTLGSAYLPGQQELLVLMAAALVYAATVPLAALFYAGDKYWYFSLSGIIQILIVVLGNLVAVPRFGLLGAAGVILLARGVVLILTGVLSLYDVFLLSNQPRKEAIK